MTQTLSFTKGHGTGNDFIVVADPDGGLNLAAEQVAALCDRRFGIGADGLLRAVRAPDTGGAWFMDYRNADGSVAEMCGNGIRVFVHYLLAAGLTQLDETGGILVGTRNGSLRVTRADEGYEADLGAFELPSGDPLVRARGMGVPRPGQQVDVGNPHIVVALPAAADLEALDLGARPRVEPEPEHGANIEFVVPDEPLVRDGVGSVRMRVFERGVGETLSCGTGVAAAALAVRHWAGPAAPDRWIVQVPGGTLGVRVARVAGSEHVLLSGPATLVYTGEIALTGS